MAKLGILPRTSVSIPIALNGETYYFGDLIEFSYSPTTKVPYFDPNPMAFFLGFQGNQMLGMNMNFIPTMYRREVLDIMLQIRIKMGASPIELQEIVKENPKITNVNIDSILFRGENISESLTGLRGVDWTAFTKFSGNPLVRMLKVGLRVYKTYAIGNSRRVKFLNEEDNEVDKQQKKVNEHILNNNPRIIGITPSDIKIASDIAIRNGNWNKYLIEKSK